MSKNNKKKAQVMVEAAIGFPLFLLLTLGAIETARFALIRIQITYASFQANRVAVVNKGDTTAVRKALERISSHIKDAKIELKDEGEEYSLYVKKTFHPLIPFVKVDSMPLAGYSRLPKGYYQNKEFPYKYKGYTSYYPGLESSSNTEDPAITGILTYDRNLRSFIKCENNPFEKWKPGWSPWGEYGGDGEAEIIVAGEDSHHDPFHLGAWYPPEGILRNPGPERNRTGSQARIDQYYFLRANLRSYFPPLPRGNLIPYLGGDKPYFSRAITGFGHGNNLHTGRDAFPYTAAFWEKWYSKGFSLSGWYGFWPRFESSWYSGVPEGFEGIVFGTYYIQSPLGIYTPWFSYDPWGPYYKNNDNWISGKGRAIGEACWTIPDPWGPDPSYGQKGWGITIFSGWFKNYLGDRRQFRNWWGGSWSDWKGNRRLYDAAFYISTYDELEWIYAVEGFLTKNHGSWSFPGVQFKDDLRGHGGEWDCLWLGSHQDRWNGKEKRR